MADVNGNTALWEAIAEKHHPIFEILYHWASVSDPYVAGDLLCTAARRNELTIMKKLLKHGLLVDSKDRHGSTATHVAIEENHVEMVQLLLLNGAEIDDTLKYKFSSMNLSEMLQKREVGHRIIVSAGIMDEVDHKWREQGHKLKSIAGQKFGFDAKDALVTGEKGAELTLLKS